MRVNRDGPRDRATRRSGTDPALLTRCRVFRFRAGRTNDFAAEQFALPHAERPPVLSQRRRALQFGVDRRHQQFRESLVAVLPEMRVASPAVRPARQIAPDLERRRRRVAVGAEPDEPTGHPFARQRTREPRIPTSTIRAEDRRRSVLHGHVTASVDAVATAMPTVATDRRVQTGAQRRQRMNVRPDDPRLIHVAGFPIAGSLRHDDHDRRPVEAGRTSPRDKSAHGFAACFRVSRFSDARTSAAAFIL